MRGNWDDRYSEPGVVTGEYEAAAKEASKNISATGPWEIDSHDSGRAWKFQAVENHWRRTPYFAEFNMWSIPEEATRVAGLETGDLDIMEMAFDSLPAVQRVEGTEIVAWPNAGQAGLNIYGQTYGVDKDGNAYQPLDCDNARVSCNEDPTEEGRRRMGEVLGLNKPYYQQYFIFPGNAVQGDFGQSVKEGRQVTDVILERLPATLYLGLAAFIVSLLVGIPLGILSAVKRGSLVDQVGKVIAMLGQSAPPFWLGIMLIIFFAVSLELLPPYGRDDFNSIVLTTITLGWYYAAANLRLVRSAMLYGLDSEYIKLARAKGVPYWGIVLRQVFRNALIPPLTFAGLTLGALLTGSLVVETVLAWPGLGKLAIEALFAFDYPLLQEWLSYSRCYTSWPPSQSMCFTLT